MEHCLSCNSDGSFQDSICKSMRHGGKVGACYLYNFNTRSKQRISNAAEMDKARRRYCKECGYADKKLKHCDYDRCTLYEFVNLDH